MGRMLRCWAMLGLLGLGACGPTESSPAPVWVGLAKGFTPQEAEPPGLEALGAKMMRWTPAEADRSHRGAWVRQRIRGEEWRDLGHGLWMAETLWVAEDLGLRGLQPRMDFNSPEGDRIQATALPGNSFGQVLAEDSGDPTRVQELVTEVRNATQSKPLSGHFTAHGRNLWLFLDEGQAPPKEARARFWIDLGAPDVQGWRVVQGSCSGFGIPLVAGVPQQVQVEVPAGSCLRFACLSDAESGAGRLRCTWNGEPLLERPVRGGDEDVVFPLPPEVQGLGTLRFDFEAASGRVVLLDPILGPAEIGGYGRRPWAARHPDLVLVSADTFRADNLAPMGGDPRWAPAMNALAEDSASFTQARSPSSWTLPAHAALLSGRMPRQISMYSSRARLGLDVVTLAEQFTDAGYRVAAVTERGYLSRAYGLEQGFGRFEEHWKMKGKTLSGMQAALDRDDGRPLLLLVHSYRAHGAYEVSPGTREELGILRSDSEVQAELAEFPKPSPGQPVDPAHAKALAEYRQLYRGASRDMDKLFAEMLQALRERSVLPGGFLALTSDHGESFGRHGVVGHGNSVWDDEVHVPLLLHGPGIEPRSVAGPASLIDVPRTLAQLCGVPVPSQWAGVDLLGSLVSRPVATFQCGQGRMNYAGIVEGQRKLVMASTFESGELGEVLYAYDLAADPLEEHSLVGEADWVPSMEKSLRPVMEALAKPMTAAELASIDGDHAAQLEAMGYAGEDE